jgi:hypothetical protein
MNLRPVIPDMSRSWAADVSDVSTMFAPFGRVLGQCWDTGDRVVGRFPARPFYVGQTGGNGLQVHPPGRVQVSTCR